MKYSLCVAIVILSLANNLQATDTPVIVELKGIVVDNDGTPVAFKVDLVGREQGQFR